MRLAAPYYDDGVDRTNPLSLRILEHLKHHLALEAAKNSPEMQQNITQVQQLAAKWFNEHMTRY
ncbi:hypothetical protein NDI47_21800 [Microcoleus vaginatus GB1-A2]|uniref:hypothetical protein n=1 Tax=Microcoleus vaginatus TaxID=119532 RepID=UPI0016881777|nr:hypothetical protein [Microcoleus sp. FACHB-61]